MFIPIWLVVLLILCIPGVFEAILAFGMLAVFIGGMLLVGCGFIGLAYMVFHI